MYQPNIFTGDKIKGLVHTDSPQKPSLEPSYFILSSSKELCFQILLRTSCSLAGATLALNWKWSSSLVRNSLGNRFSDVPCRTEEGVVDASAQWRVLWVARRGQYAQEFVIPPFCDTRERSGRRALRKQRRRNFVVKRGTATDWECFLGSATHTWYLNESSSDILNLYHIQWPLCQEEQRSNVSFTSSQPMPLATRVDSCFVNLADCLIWPERLALVP